MRPAGFPEHESVHSRARGQITLGSPLLFRGESSATAARISRRAQAAAAVAARSANESRCVWPLSSRPDAPTLGQSISSARAPAGTSPVSPMRPVRTGVKVVPLHREVDEAEAETVAAAREAL